MNIDEAKALLGERRIQVDSDGETFIRRCTKVDVILTLDMNGTESTDCWRVWSDGRFGKDREFETFMPVDRWLALPPASQGTSEGKQHEQTR